LKTISPAIGEDSKGDGVLIRKRFLAPLFRKDFFVILELNEIGQNSCLRGGGCHGKKDY
jgi:hypothetical protein